MTTSGVATWNPQLLHILKEAMTRATVVDADEDVTSTQYESALFTLNGLVKSIEATGAHVWTEEEAILFLQPGQQRYVLGAGAGLPTPPGPDHATDADSWLELTLAAPAAAAATHITVQDASRVASGMNVGVVDNSGATQWFTVSGAPVGPLITLSGPLTVGADAGNYALAYATKIARPLKVPNARLLTLNGLNETPMTILSRQEYMDLPNKGNRGVPTQWFYTPRRDQGFLYPWPVAQMSAWAMRFTWYRPLQDYLQPGDTGDFPQEWINPLTWNLAKELAPGEGVPDATWNRIKEMADAYSMLAVDYDRESEPIQFGIEYPDGRP